MRAKVDIVVRLNTGVYGTNRIALCAETSAEIIQLREALRLALQPDTSDDFSAPEVRETVAPAPTHHYIVAYFHSNGLGRSFVSMMGPVDSPDGVVAMEALLLESNPTLRGIGVTNFKPLRVGFNPSAQDDSESAP